MFLDELVFDLQENLSQEEQLKKQKNRDAAKKCREKKEKEAQQLKSVS